MEARSVKKVWQRSDRSSGMKQAEVEVEEVLDSCSKEE